jgi:hypothetical protein
MTHPPIGSKKKREIAMVIASILEPGRRYSATEIERMVSQNVKGAVLAQRGLAPDHIRRAMIENGYVERDAATNETWVASTFEGIQDVHGPRLARLMSQLAEAPESRGVCPECGSELRIAALLNHYQKKHANGEPWEYIVEQYFGW